MRILRRSDVQVEACCVCVCVCVYTYIYTYMNSNTYSNVFIYIHIYSYTHTQRETHRHTPGIRCRLWTRVSGAKGEESSWERAPLMCASTRQRVQKPTCEHVALTH
jgi:hypothetical protein